MNKHLLAVMMTVLAVYTTGSAGEFTVQVHSSSDREAAEKAQQDLQADGFNAYIARLEADSIKYRVRIGRFPSLTEAEQVRDALRQKGIESWIAPADRENGDAKRPESESPDKNLSADEGEAPPAAPAETIPGPEATTTAPTSPEPSTTTSLPPAREQAPARQSGAAVSDSAPLHELVVNPVPDFSRQVAAHSATTTIPAPGAAVSAGQPAVKPAPAATSVPRCSPEKYSTYYDQRGSTLRVSPGEPGLTGAEKKQARQLIVFPVFCRQLNLQELTAQVDMEESSVTLALDGLARSRQLPARQAVKEFEALLLGSPLRVIYWQQKTEPDGTLHGALFFKTGEPVEQEMIRRGLAEADAGQAAP